MQLKELSSIIKEAKNKKQAFLWLFFLILSSILLYHSLIAPQSRQIKKIRLNLLSKKNLLSYYQNLAKDPNILLAKVEAARKELKTLEKNFVPAREAEKALDYLKGVVAETQNSLLSIQTQEAYAAGSYQKLPVAISVKGHYVDVLSLIGRLENYQRLANIKTVTIAPAEDKNTQVTADLVIELFMN